MLIELYTTPLMQFVNELRGSVVAKCSMVAGSNIGNSMAAKSYGIEFRNAKLEIGMVIISAFL